MIFLLTIEVFLPNPGLCDKSLIRRVGESNYLTVRDTGRAPEACDEFGAEERHNEAVHIFQTTGRVILVI